MNTLQFKCNQKLRDRFLNANKNDITTREKQMDVLLKDHINKGNIDIRDLYVYE